MGNPLGSAASLVEELVNIDGLQMFGMKLSMSYAKEKMTEALPAYVLSNPKVTCSGLSGGAKDVICKMSDGRIYDLYIFYFFKNHLSYIWT